jgi:hypothetical protein
MLLRPPVQRLLVGRQREPKQAHTPIHPQRNGHRQIQG